MMQKLSEAQRSSGKGEGEVRAAETEGLNETDEEQGHMLVERVHCQEQAHGLTVIIKCNTHLA